MYLKALEIQGFKSMADRVELKFNPGVTAVVGPNGSGKSNISDAIRWVLGEQSAKSLRGAKMEDIIFSGSDKRKPVGMAEVTLTLDNSSGIFPSEYSEINVTRRVFRSGESEFFINKIPCRLKDIHELFMDTGIGREGYSIIGQGKIDEILSTKSEDRRQVIEEAAGIVKYKNRKIQAVRKLEDTEQNLVRISDIITELENQLGPLHDQADKARSFLSYKDELDKLEVSLAVHQLGDQKARLDELLGEEKSLSDSIVALETEVRKMDSTIEELKHSVNVTNEEITDLQHRIYEKGSSVEKLESDVRLNGERISNLVERKSRLEEEIQALQEKEAFIKEQSKKETEEYQDLVMTISLKEQEVYRLEQGLGQLESGNKDKLNEIERLKGEVFDTLNAVAGLNNNIHALEAEENSLNNRKQHLEKALSEVIEEQEMLIDDLVHMAAREEEFGLEVKGLETKIKETVARINKTNTERKQAEEAMQVIITERQNLASKLKVLEEMEQDYDGYHKGVREILKAMKHQKVSGLCGVIAELISVPKKYEIAIEIALGSALQFVVSRTEGEAQGAITYLKKCNAGRATFLPLDTIKGRELRTSEEVLKIKGCHGVAARLISFKKEYAPAIENLLGNILIAENLEVATKIAKNTGYGIKVVTLEGDVVNPGGSLTGGSYVKSRNSLLGRKREIEELHGRLKAIDAKVKAACDERDALRLNGDQLQELLEDTKSRLQKVNLEIAGLKAEKEQMKLQLNKLSQTSEVYAYEKDQLLDRLEDIKTQKSQVNNEIAMLNKKNEELNLAVANLQRDCDSLELQKAGLSEELTQHRIDLAKLKQEEVSLRQGIDRVNNDIADINMQVKIKTEEATAVAGQQKELQDNINSIKERITISLSEKLGMEESLSELRNKRDNLSSEISLKENAAKSKNKEFTNMQNEIHGIEVKKARLETEIENQQNKLLEEFSLTFEEALLVKVEIGSKRETSSRIKELKTFINGLGPVNLSAIEEYEKVSERYDFLSAQYKDLEQARVSLYQVIEEMDQIMSKRFKKAYEEINHNFRKVFGELFGGGFAELQMTDKERILETGIEIIAQPPGKKPQHLSLLSGGERALTAIALLFAVLMVKPSPFCVLDEIEASLDEANVDRYAEFLQKFSKDTQFIVVTHRKGTMEVANVLYGVTMDETGVSKMVSVRLADAIDKVS